MFFIGVVIVLAMFPAITGNQSILTNTANSYTNTTVTLGDVNVAKEVSTPCEQGIISSVITNKTNGTVIATSSYSTSQMVGAKGVLASAVTLTDAGLANKSFNISCVYKPYGYVEDSGGRTVAGLIVIFAALALLGFAFYKLSETMSWLGF